MPPPPPSQQTLSSGLKTHGKLYWGVATDPKHLSNNPLLSTLIATHFNQLTPENCLKWSSLQSTRGKFTFSLSDTLITFAEKHSMLIRGHTLLWHRSLPHWVLRITSPAELESVIIQHIRAVVGRYAGRIFAWDVVNEIFTDSGELRRNHFMEILGEGYVGIAFHAARDADQGARLYVNDYFTGRGKVEAAREWIGGWKREGVEIDGVGVQGHVSRGESGRMRWILERLGEVVEEVAITELDIVDAGEGEYVEVVKACLGVEKCVGITSWGVRDEESWRKEGKPCLWEEGGEGEWVGKPALDAVVRFLCE